MSFHSKRKKILELLPQLITKNEEEGKKMLAKLKVNSFFSEYDNKASNRLKSMISLSGRRYKKLKNGESFKISLGESSEKLKKFSENLLSDTLFFNNELLLKQKNLLKKTSPNKEKENGIKTLIKEIRKSSSMGDLNNIYLEQGSTNIDTQDNVILNRKKAKEIILQKLDEDHRNITKSINNYINKIRTYDIHPPDIISKKRNKINIKDSVKMLNFKKYSLLEHKAKKEDEDVSIKTINKIINDDYKTLQVKRIKIPEKSLIKEYSDTVTLLKQEAINNLFYHDKITNNYDKITSLIDIKFPELNEYETIIKQKLRASKLSRNLSQIEKFPRSQSLKVIHQY